jgi:hypothetical protein
MALRGDPHYVCRCGRGWLLSMDEAAEADQAEENLQREGLSELHLVEQSL